MSKNISILESIEINASPEKIFDYVSNLDNDPKWRPEVEKMEVQDGSKLGTLVTEHIKVYRYFHFVTPILIKVLNRPAEFIVETPSTHPTWVHCIRSTKVLEHEKTKFTVQLSFSLDNMKQILPIIPPGKLVMMWYRPRIRKYLQTLKRIMEASA